MDKRQLHSSIIGSVHQRAIMSVRSGNGVSSGWQDGFYGVAIDAIADSPGLVSPVPAVTKSVKKLRNSEQVLRSIYSPSYLKHLTPKSPGLSFSMTESPERVPATKTPQGAVIEDEDVFFSPNQFSLGASLSSPFSVSEHSSASFRALTSIEMLSPDYIQKCSNVDEIREIVDVLKRERKHLPTLSRQAEERLKSLANPSNMNPDASQEVPPHAPHSSGTSPTVNSLAYSEDDDALSPRLFSPPVGKHVCFSIGLDNSHSKGQKCSNDIELTKEVDRLKSTIVELENLQRKEQTEYWQKIQRLDESKVQLERKLSSMQEKMDLCEKVSQEMMQQLQSMKEDNQTLEAQLECERSAFEHQKRQSTAIERQLRQKISELSEELCKVKNQNQTASSMSNHDYVALNKALHETQKNLEDLRFENAVMIRAMAMGRGGGKPVDDIQNLPRKERRETIAELSREAAVSSTARYTLAGELNRCVRMQKAEAERRQHAENLRADSDAAKADLEKRNMELSLHIQNLTRDLEASRAEINRILQCARTKQKDEGTREAKLSNIIHGLKRELRDGKSYSRLLKSETTKSRELEKEVIHLKNQIQSMRSETGRKTKKQFGSLSTADLDRQPLDLEAAISPVVANLLRKTPSNNQAEAKTPSMSSRSGPPNCKKVFTFSPPATANPSKSKIAFLTATKAPKVEGKSPNPGKENHEKNIVQSQISTQSKTPLSKRKILLERVKQIRQRNSPTSQA